MTLIIYDSEGKLVSPMSGNYVKPIGGLKYLETEVPDCKYVTGVDVSVTPNAPIYENYPINPVEVLQDRIDYIEGTVNELLGV